MASVLPVPVPIRRECLPATLSSVLVVGFPLDQFQVAVPPFVPALVTAETLLFPLRYLPDFLAAVRAERYVVSIDNRSFHRLRHSAESVSLAVRLDRVQVQSQLIGHLSVAVTPRPQHLYPLLLLIAYHKTPRHPFCCISEFPS